MQDNDDLLNIIKRNLSKENVECDENQISLYDLYNLLNSKYEELRSVTGNNKIFSNKELFGRKSYNQVVFIRDKEKSEIYIYPTKTVDEAFIINKDINDDNIYINKFRNSSNKFIKRFVKNYYDDIMEVFSVLENYGSILDLEEEIKKLEFKCGNYTLVITINLYGIVNLEFKQNEDDINIYPNKYLINVLEKNKFELAKKIMINVDELDYQIRDFIKEKNKNNVKKFAI